MDRMPQEIKDQILDLLPYKDLPSIRLVQQTFYKHGTELLFRTVCIRVRKSPSSNTIVDVKEEQSDDPDSILKSRCNKMVHALTDDQLRKAAKSLIFLNTPISLLAQSRIVEKMSQPFELKLFCHQRDHPASPGVLNETLVGLAGLKIPFCKELSIRASGSSRFLFDTQTFKAQHIQKVLEDQAYKKPGSCLHSLSVLLLNFERNRYPLSYEISATTQIEAREILATMLDFAPNLKQMQLHLCFADKVTRQTVPYPVQLQDVLLKRQAWNNLNYLSLGGVSTTGAEMVQFLRAHKGVLTRLGLHNISLTESEETVCESFGWGTRIGWFEIMHFLRDEMELTCCSLSGQLCEFFDGGLGWVSWAETFSSRPRVPRMNQIRDAQTGRMTTSLRFAIHAYILEQGRWPFPDRAWFDRYASQRLSQAWPSIVGLDNYPPLNFDQPSSEDHLIAARYLYLDGAVLSWFPQFGDSSWRGELTKWQA